MPAISADVGVALLLYIPEFLPAASDTPLRSPDTVLTDVGTSPGKAMVPGTGAPCCIDLEARTALGLRVFEDGGRT